MALKTFARFRTAARLLTASALLLSAVVMTPARAQEVAPPVPTGQRPDTPVERGPGDADSPRAEADKAPGSPTPLAVTEKEAPAKAPASPAPESQAKAKGAVQPLEPPPSDHSGALNALSMFQSADPIVKSVMIGLGLASVLTWTMLFLMFGRISLAKRRIRLTNAALLQSRSLSDFDALRGRSELPNSSHAALLLDAAELEVALSEGLPAENVVERVKLAMTRVEDAINRRITSGLGILAIIGSTGPFVGLFGTVWGIMHSFVSIANSQTTNLSVVAPGIAEALLATAIGLVAAIPAVVFYNVLTRQASAYRALVHDAESFILRHLSRDLDRRDLAGTASIGTLGTRVNGEHVDPLTPRHSQAR